eukprot:scaffold142828_cov37-Tisochrysis_lutea.AAC.3
MRRRAGREQRGSVTIGRKEGGGKRRHDLQRARSGEEGEKGETKGEREEDGERGGKTCWS